MTTEWELDAAGFEEATREPADAYEGYAEYLDSLPESLPEDFGPTPERAAEILAECNGLPF